jgi:hypothetical protein
MYSGSDSYGSVPDSIVPKIYFHNAKTVTYDYEQYYIA